MSGSYCSKPKRIRQGLRTGVQSLQERRRPTIRAHRPFGRQRTARVWHRALRRRRCSQRRIAEARSLQRPSGSPPPRSGRHRRCRKITATWEGRLPHLAPSLTLTSPSRREQPCRQPPPVRLSTWAAASKLRPAILSCQSVLVQTRKAEECQLSHRHAQASFLVLRLPSAGPFPTHVPRETSFACPTHARAAMPRFRPQSARPRHEHPQLACQCSHRSLCLQSLRSSKPPAGAMSFSGRRRGTRNCHLSGLSPCLYLRSRQSARRDRPAHSRLPRAPAGTTRPACALERAREHRPCPVRLARRSFENK